MIFKKNPDFKTEGALALKTYQFVWSKQISRLQESLPCLYDSWYFWNNFNDFQLITSELHKCSREPKS